MDAKEQELFNAGVEQLKQAKVRIQELETEKGQMATKVATTDKAASALSDGLKPYETPVIDALVRQGFLTEDQRAIAKDGLRDPIKVAAQLQVVLERTATRPVGSPAPATAKQAASDIEECNDTYRKAVGLA